MSRSLLVLWFSLLISMGNCLEVREHLLLPNEVKSDGHVLLQPGEWQQVLDFQAAPLPSVRLSDLRTRLNVYAQTAHLSFSATVTAASGVRILPPGYGLVSVTPLENAYFNSAGLHIRSSSPLEVRVEAVWPLTSVNGEVDSSLPWALPYPGEMHLLSDAGLLDARVVYPQSASDLYLPATISSEGISSLRIRGREKGSRAQPTVIAPSIKPEEKPTPQVFAELSQKFQISRDDTVVTIRVNLEISRHPIRELELQVPAGLEILGLEDSSTPATFDAASSKVRFTREVRNRAHFTIQGRVMLSAAAAGFEFPGLVRTAGTVSEKTWLALQAKDVLRIKDVSFEHVDRVYRVDVSELPEFLRPADGEPVLYSCRILGDAGSMRIDAELFERLEPLNLLIAAFHAKATFHADHSALHHWDYRLEVEREGTYEFSIPEGYTLRQARLNNREIPVFTEKSGTVSVDLRPSPILRRGENQSYNLLQSRAVVGGLQEQNLTLVMMSPPTSEDVVAIPLPLPEHARNLQFSVHTEDGLDMPRVQSTFDNPRWNLAEGLNTTGKRLLSVFLLPLGLLLAVLAYARTGAAGRYLISEWTGWQLFRHALCWILGVAWLLSAAGQVMGDGDIVPMPSPVYQSSALLKGQWIQPQGSGSRLFSLVGHQSGHVITVDFRPSPFPLSQGAQVVVCLLLALLMLLVQFNKPAALPLAIGLVLLFWTGCVLNGQLQEPEVWLWVQPLAVLMLGIVGLTWRIRKQLAVVSLASFASLQAQELDVFLTVDQQGNYLRFIRDEDYKRIFIKEVQKEPESSAYGVSQGKVRMESNSLILDLHLSVPASDRQTAAMPRLFSKDLILNVSPAPASFLEQGNGPVFYYPDGLPAQIHLTYLLNSQARQFLHSGGQISMNPQPQMIQSLDFDCDNLLVEAQIARLPGTCRFYIPSGSAQTFTLRHRRSAVVVEDKAVDNLQALGLRANALHVVKIREGLLDMSSTFTFAIDGVLSSEMSMGLPEGLLIKSVSSPQNDLVDWSRPNSGSTLLLNFRPGVSGQAEVIVESEQLLTGTSATLKTFNLPVASQLETLWRFEPEPGLEFRLGLSEGLEKLLRQRTTSSAGYEIEELRTKEVSNAEFYLNYQARDSVETYKALIDLMEMSAYFSSDGNLYLRRALVIRNNAEQFLELKPMPSEQLLTARLHSQRAAIGVRGDRWLLPLRMILNQNQEVSPFTMELTTRIPLPQLGEVTLEPAHVLLPVAQATLQASIHPGARLQVKPGKWAPLQKGQVPMFQENLPNTWQGRIQQSAADWHPPYHGDGVNCIQWFLTADQGLSQITLMIQRSWNPNLLAFALCALVLMVLLTSSGVRWYLLLLLPWVFTLPVAMTGVIAFAACLTVCLRLASVPMVYMRTLFFLALATVPTKAQTEVMHRVLPWSQIQSKTGLKLVSAAEIESILSSMKPQVSAPAPMPVLSVRISEGVSHVLELDLTITIPKTEKRACLPIIPAGWSLPDRSELLWKHHERGLCLSSDGKAQTILTKALVYLNPKDASLPLPDEAFVTIESFTSRSGYSVEAGSGFDLSFPVSVVGIPSLRLKLPTQTVTMEVVEDRSDFSQVPAEVVRIHDYALVAGTGNHDLSMDLHIHVSHQSLQSVSLPQFDGFRLRQMQVQPRQSFFMQDGVLNFPKGVSGAIRVLISGEISASTEGIQLSTQSLEHVLGGRLQVYVKDNLRISEEINPGLIPGASEGEYLQQKVPMLRAYRFRSAFPGFAAKVHNLQAYSLGQGPLQSLQAQTLILDTERVATSLSAKMRVPPSHELAVPLPDMDRLLGVYINKEPAKAFTNASGELMIQFPAVLADALVTLEIKYLSKTSPSARIQLPEPLMAGTIQWQIWHAAHQKLLGVKSSLSIKAADDQVANPMQKAGLDYLVPGFISGLFLAFQVGFLGILFYLLFKALRYILAAVKELLEGIQSPLFQKWMKRGVGVAVLFVAAIGSAMVLALLLTLAPGVIDEMIPNFRKARARTYVAEQKALELSKREFDMMDELAASDSAYPMAEAEGFAGNGLMQQRPQSQAARQKSIQGRREALGSLAPPPPPAPLAKESRVKKGNIKPVNVVMPALPEVLLLESSLPIGEAAWVEFSLGQKSNLMDNSAIRALGLLVLAGLIAKLLAMQARWWLTLVLMLCTFIPFIDSRLVSMILPLSLIVFVRRRQLLALVLVSQVSLLRASELSVYRVWDSEARSLILSDKVLVSNSVPAKPMPSLASEVFCSELSYQVEDTSGTDWLTVSMKCLSPIVVEPQSLPSSKPLSRAYLMPASTSVRMLDSLPTSTYLFADSQGYWISLNSGSSQVSDLVFRFMLRANRENYGDVLRISLPKPAHAVAWLDSEPIGFYPEQVDGSTQGFVRHFAVGKGAVDLRLHRRQILNSGNPMRNFSVIVDDRRPHYESSVTFAPSRYGVLTSMSLSVQSTQAVVMYWPESAMTRSFTLRRGRQILKQGMDYGISPHLPNYKLLEWNASREAITVDFEYYTPALEHIVVLPVKVQGRTTSRFLFKANTEGNFRVSMEPEPDSMPHLRQSLSSGREGWQILNPQPQLSEIGLFHLRYLERENATSSVSKLSSVNLDVRLADRKRIYGTITMNLLDPEGQFFVIRLPPGAQVYEARVLGQIAKLAVEGDDCLIPLPPASRNSRSVQIQLSYHQNLHKTEGGKYVLGLPVLPVSPEVLAINVLSKHQLKFNDAPMTFRFHDSWQAKRQGGMPEKPIEFEVLDEAQKKSSPDLSSYWQLGVFLLVLLGLSRLTGRAESFALLTLAAVFLVLSHGFGVIAFVWYLTRLVARGP